MFDPKLSPFTQVFFYNCMDWVWDLRCFHDDDVYSPAFSLGFRPSCPLGIKPPWAQSSMGFICSSRLSDSLGGKVFSARILATWGPADSGKTVCQSNCKRTETTLETNVSGGIKPTMCTVSKITCIQKDYPLSRNRDKLQILNMLYRDWKKKGVQKQRESKVQPALSFWCMSGLGCFC